MDICSILFRGTIKVS
ncbi:hypothetical protein ACFDC9_13430 [Escherichia coli]